MEKVTEPIQPRPISTSAFVDLVRALAGYCLVIGFFVSGFMVGGEIHHLIPTALLVLFLIHLAYQIYNRLRFSRTVTLLNNRLLVNPIFRGVEEVYFSDILGIRVEAHTWKNEVAYVTLSSGKKFHFALSRRKVAGLHPDLALLMKIIRHQRPDFSIVS